MVPKHQHSQIVEALRISLDGKSNLKCDNGSLYSISASLDKVETAQEILISKSEQPALVARFNTSEAQSSDYYFLTTSDYKSVTGFSFQSYTTKRVNVGTLLEPDFQFQKVTTSLITCTLQ